MMEIPKKIDAVQAAKMNHSLKIENVQIKAGAVCYEEKALLLTENGDTACFSFPFFCSAGIIEITELHQRNDVGFAYEVYIGETPIYFRTYEPIADAPASVFIRISSELISAKNLLVLRIVCRKGPIRIASVVLHDRNITTLPSEDQMSVGFFSPRFCWHDMEKDIAEVERIKADFGNPSMFSLMLGFDIFYMNRSDKQLKEILSYLLTVAERTETELFLDYNTWWSGTPDGPDGKGGYFTDVEYNQVIYDPLSEKYSLSVPNMWSNTPWYTMNNETLNKIRNLRAGIAVDILQRLLVERYQNADSMPKVSLFIDNEPTYWANFAYTDSPDSGGDFCLDAHHAAVKDGVSLRTGGSITEQQRLWMLKNLNDYICGISAALKNSADKEYAFVSKEGVAYSNRNLSEQIYTHIFPTPCYPYFHFKHPQWETHITNDAKLGLENCLWGDLRIMDYAIQFGKLAEINAERCCYPDDHTFLHMYYMYGAEAGMIFNYYPEDPKEIRGIGEAGNTLFTDPDYAYPVYTYDVFFDEAKAPGLIKNEGISIRPYRQRKVLQPVKPGKGSITLNVGKIKDYPNGARLELMGFVKPKNGGITISVGKTPESFIWEYALPQHDNTDDVILTDLPIGEFAPEDDLYLKIEITSNSFDEDWAQLNYIWSIRVLAPYEKCAGHTDGFRFTYDEKRSLSRMVIYRRECEKMIEKFPWLEEKTKIMLQSEQYLFAYEQMKHILSESKTAQFYIREEGTLGKYPLSVKTTAPVYLTVSSEEHVLTVTAEGNAGAVITICGQSGLSMRKTGINCWVLSDGEQPSVSLELQKKNCLPEGFVGRFQHWNGNSAVVQSQDMEAFQYQSQFTLEIGENAEIWLKPEENKEFLPASRDEIEGGDMLEAEIKDGIATVLRFTRGECRGVILSVTPMEFVCASHNAFITLLMDDGQVRSFEIGRECALQYSGASAGDSLCCGKDGLGLEPNERVVVRYCPYQTHGRMARAISISSQ